MSQIWDRAHISCDKKVFNGVDVLALTPEQLDDYCLKAGICWEQVGEKAVMIHGCGSGCFCHSEDATLRP